MIQRTIKYVISESRVEELIVKFLDKNYRPDYDWGPDLFDFYKKDSERYGYLDFVINDIRAYLYLLKEDEWENNKPKTLVLQDWIGEQLTDLFGDMWKPVFVKWFEKNTNLPVEHLIVRGSYSMNWGNL